MKPILTLFVFALFLTLTACNSLPLPIPTQSTPTSAPTHTPSATPTPLATPTLTPLPPLLVLLAPPNADPSLAEALGAEIAQRSAESGLRWQVRPSLNLQETADQVSYVVALPPVDGLSELVESAPQTRFLAVGITGLEPAENLISIGGEGPSPARQGFLGGYIAAMITEQWRVGTISVEDSQDGQDGRVGFQNGVKFFCGLCRPASPPFYEYPLFVGLPAGASEAEWRALGDFMVDRAVRTAYIQPQADGEDLLRYLAQNGVNILGGVPRPDGIQDHWVASLRTDIKAAYLDYLPRLLAGQTGISEPLLLSITDVNPDLLSPGKQRFAEEILKELQAGFIDPGSQASP